MKYLLMQKTLQMQMNLMSSSDLTLSADDQQTLSVNFAHIAEKYVGVTNQYTIEANGGPLWLSKDLTGLIQVISRGNRVSTSAHQTGELLTFGSGVVESIDSRIPNEHE
jgi:hypothetical protein